QPRTRHQRWYHRHHTASKARSALRGWALRNGTRELVESAAALGAICLPKCLAFDRVSEDRDREDGAPSVEKLELALVERRSSDARDRAERFAAAIIRCPSQSL